MKIELQQTTLYPFVVNLGLSPLAHNGRCFKQDVELVFRLPELLPGVLIKLNIRTASDCFNVIKPHYWHTNFGAVFCISIM